MKRHLCATALLALVLIPDWASACWRWGGRVYYARAYYMPRYRAPVYYASQPVCQQPVYVQPCQPAPAPMLAPPRVEPARPNASSAIPEPARPVARPNPAPAPAPVQVKPPEVERVRPASATEVPKAQPTKPESARPEPAPAPPPDKPKSGLFSFPKIPTPDSKLPPLELPKTDEPKRSPKVEPKIVQDTKPEGPKLELPKPDGPKPPALELPKHSDPKLPSLELPKERGAEPKAHSPEPTGGAGHAVPTPAPAPDALIPAPGIPTPKGPDSLPPLTLPPDTPISPIMPEKTEVKSSPLTGTGKAAARELKVSVFPAAGGTTAGGLRKIGFYNHTGRDLSLTIEGKTVTLPAKSYLHAQLPTTFTWKCADRPAAKETVPADAAGVDVLIRE